MNIKEFEKLLNDKVEELKLNKTSITKCSIETNIRYMVEDLVDTEKFEVHYGGDWYENQNRNRLYINPRYKGHNDWGNSFIEIQIHKTLDYTGWEGGKWYITKLTAKPFGEKEITFEEAFDTYKDYIEDILVKREKEKKREEEQRAKAEEEKLRHFEEVKGKILKYIEDNKLDPKEFKDIARELDLYDRTYINGEYYYIIQNNT